MTVSSFQYDSPLVYDNAQVYDAFAATVTPNVVPVLPHLASSLQLQADGSFAFWQQDSLDEVGQSVEMIVGSTYGERTVVPNFGVSDLTFTNPNKGSILEAVEHWEPRAAVSVDIQQQNNNAPQVNVRVSLIKGSIS